MGQCTRNIIAASIICFFTLICTSALFAGSIKLSWNPPNANSDGTPLTDLSGYKIYYGTEPNLYTDSLDVGNVTSYRVGQLKNGTTYYFAVIAYDYSGNESEHSNEVSLDVSGSDKKPSPPGRLRVSKNVQ